MLDLFFISDNISSNYDVSVSAPFGNSDHRSITAVPKFGPISSNNVETRVYDLRESNIALLVSELQKINWFQFYRSDESSDFKCNLFHDIMTAYVDKYIPQHIVLFTEKDKPWITPLLKYFIQRRWNSYRRRDFKSYYYWKFKVQEEIINAKRKWSSRASNDTKSLWKVVNDIRGTKTFDPVRKLCIQLGGSATAVKLINNSFANEFTYIPSSVNMASTVSDETWSVKLSVSDVERRLMKVKNHKASGRDRIPTAIYKAATSVIARPLCHIFCLSVNERNFPTRWKYSHVSPIPKHGLVDINNLRPISLLPLPGKLLESIVLQGHVKEAIIKSIRPCQFGGRPAHRQLRLLSRYWTVSLHFLIWTMLVVFSLSLMTTQELLTNYSTAQ